MKKKIEGILDFIRKMEQNTFLLKDNYSDTIPLLSCDYEYRTYVGNRGDKDRFINIDLFQLGVEKLKIQFRKNEIRLDKPVDYKFSIDDAYKIVELIFEEVHSFKNHDEGVRKLKQSIINKQKRIKQEQEELSKMQIQLKDALTLITNQQP